MTNKICTVQPINLTQVDNACVNTSSCARAPIQVLGVELRADNQRMYSDPERTYIVWQQGMGPNAPWCISCPSMLIDTSAKSGLLKDAELKMIELFKLRRDQFDRLLRQAGVDE